MLFSGGRTSAYMTYRILKGCAASCEPFMGD
nr:MAG TPA: ATPase [Caudoviricetes sp.]